MMEEPDLVVLARVVDRGSFARAAQHLGVPPSPGPRGGPAVAAGLGGRAPAPTTRHVRATEIGELLAARGRRVRAEIEDAERVVADHRQTPRGVLRIAFPTPAAELLGPVLADMLTRHPDLRVELVASDKPIELVAEGFDAAIHVGSTDVASTYGVTRLGQVAPALAASADYLERVPRLQHPRDLANPAYTIIAGSRRPKWTFVHGKAGNKITVALTTPRATVSSKMVGGELVAAGIGFGLIHRTTALAYPQVRILEPGGYRPAPGSIAIITPSAHTAAPKARAFVSAMKAYVSTRPDVFT